MNQTETTGVVKHRSQIGDGREVGKEKERGGHGGAGNLNQGKNRREKDER